MKKLLPIWFLFGLVGLLSWVMVFPTFSGEYSDEVSLLRLAAAGDVIMHLPVVQSAYDSTIEQYDFRPCFQEVKEYLNEADLAVAVLETTLAGERDKNFIGYPTFKAPPAIADALQWAGIDLVFTAHNHALDQGTKGVRNTLAYLDRIGLPHTGSRVKAEDPEYRILEKNGFKLAFLSYTTSTNGIPIPPGEKYIVNMLDFNELHHTIQKVEELGADGIVLALHTGVEYERQPSIEQQEMVERLMKAGVDIVLGSHVHVIQPYELRKAPGANMEPRDCFVAYSLGNFLSNQQWRYSDCGLMVTLELKKNSRKSGLKIRIINHQPIWVHRYSVDGKYVYRIKKVMGPDFRAEPDPGLTKAAQDRMAEVWNETEELLNHWTEKMKSDNCMH